MMTQILPPRPNLEHLSKHAKQLRKALLAQDLNAAKRVANAHPRFARLTINEILARGFSLGDAQLVIAREYGFDSWSKLKRHVEQTVLDADGKADALITAALSGDFHLADALLQENPKLSSMSFWTGCVLGEADSVGSLLDESPALANQRGGPKAWEPLLYVCHSRFLGRESKRDAGMLRIAARLLELGADANAFFRINDDPNAKQTALYGAAGIANQAAMTQLLLDAGADPNDDAPGLGPESLYHAAEFENHECLRLILEAKPDPDKVSYCLGRKLDFDDHEGVRVFLAHGADPNFVVPGQGSGSRLHGAIRRRRRIETIELLLDHGADMSIRTSNGQTPYALAVRIGYAEAAALMKRRGASDAEFTEIDRFLGACSRADEAAIKKILRDKPDLMTSLTEDDQQLLPEAAMHGNVAAVRAMLDVGFDIAAARDQKMSALHWAAWYGNFELVRTLLTYNPSLEEKNMYGGTPLDAAVFGSVHCHHPQGGSTAGGVTEDVRHGDYAAVVSALIDAGANVGAVSPFPSGNAAVDAVLQPHVGAPDSLETGSELDDEAPIVNGHVRSIADFYQRRVRLPRDRAPLREVLLHEAEVLLEGHRARDLGAAMMIQLCSIPGRRPTDEAVFDAEITLEDARQTIATSYLFDSWEAVERLGDHEVDPRFEAAADAVVAGDEARLSDLLAKDPTLVEARSAFGHESTLLHYCAANGVENRRQRTPRNAARIVSILIEAGAVVDALSGSGGGGLNQTTLCLTVSSGHPHDVGVQGDIVDALLDGGAAINGVNNDSMPLATAIAFGYLETAERLAARGARVDNVVLAAGLGRSDLIESMTDSDGLVRGSQRYVDPFGFVVDSERELKDRAFFVACRLGHLEAATLLLDRGANIQFAPMRNQSALHWAAHNGHLPVVRLLVGRGADVSAKEDQWGATPAEWATAGGQVDVFDYLTRKP